jgi:tRNA pseudouridine55 synthase
VRASDQGLRRSGGGENADGGAPALNGLVVVDKEAGCTSHDVVAKLRRILQRRRIGHAGTLDPDATGVLLVGVGRFTRMLRYLGSGTKTYDAEVVLGVATSTLDASGEVVGRWDMSGVTLEQVRAAAASLTGSVHQVPPMVSAVKVGGRRLHELARAGLEVERAPREVTIDRFDVERSDDPGIYRIHVVCSTGTYVRTLASDLGALLGGGAHLRELRRTRVGSFGVDEARRLSEIDESCVLAPAEALRELERVEVEEEVAKLVSNGLPLDRVAIGAPGDGPWALVDRGGVLLAVYEATPTDRIVAGCVLASSG